MIKAIDLSKSNILYNFSNPLLAQQNAFQYLGNKAVLYKSNNKHKKYSVIEPDGKIVNFGQLGYEDFTKHHDEKRRQNYLKRTANMKGDWRSNKYSPNNLSRNILW